ncbi:MAG TPA: ThiF family adenylyltransferase [Gemmataceae bacterium]|nr:ThiF family adenylyltransferase [Gemmataceae bacterium]
MCPRTHHEALYRGPDVVARLAKLRVVLCGAGALGSNLADNLVRQGLAVLRVIDRDKVETHNVGTQVYGAGEVGAWKVEALKNRLFRACGVEIEALNKELTEKTADRALAGAGLVIDAFDNSASRRLVQEASRRLALPCLHVGLNADYAEVLWDESYRVPNDVGGDVCVYPLARNLVLLAVAVASEVVVRFVADGSRENRTITLKDYAIREAASGSRS